MSKVCVITGATAGIGFETVRSFAKAGYKVFMLVRSPEKGEAAKQQILTDLPSADLELINGNLASFASIRKAASQIKEKTDRLDVLVNVAGVFVTKYIPSEDGIEMTMAVNYYGLFLFTMELLDLIRQTAKETGDARILNVSSFGHKGLNGLSFKEEQCKTFLSCQMAYAYSKVAVNYFTEYLAEEYGSEGITAQTMNPGVVSTTLIRKEYTSSRFEKIVQPIHMKFPIAKDPSVPADALLWLAESDESKAHNGAYWNNKKLGKAREPRNANEQRKRLIKESMKKVGIKEN